MYRSSETPVLQEVSCAKVVNPFFATSERKIRSRNVKNSRELWVASPIPTTDALPTIRCSGRRSRRLLVASVE
jgi:hypothetical protein